MFARPITDLASDSQVFIVVQEIIRGLPLDAEQQIADGPEQRALSRFVLSEYDVEIGGMGRETQIQIRKRSERRDV